MIKRLATIGASLALPLASLFNALPASAVTCTPTGFLRDGINMTAALINPAGTVSDEVDATGCNIGVYYDLSSGGINGADIHGSNYFGVVVNGDVNNISVDVQNSTIHQIGETSFNGTQHGVAIYYRALGIGTASGNVVGNSIYDYQKGGLAINGSGAEVNVMNNDVRGLNEVLFIAQNGIQFGYGATGTAMGNSVESNWYTGADWASTGILLFETNNVVVQKNDVLNNQVGIGIETWCWFEPSASNNKVIDNDISGSDFGVTVAAYSLGGYSNCDASADNNKVTNNSITADDGLKGVFVGSGVFGGTDSPSATNNKVIHNNINGYEDEISLLDDSDTKIHANVINP